jgi:hypothetical protein
MVCVAVGMAIATATLLPNEIASFDIISQLSADGQFFVKNLCRIHLPFTYANQPNVMIANLNENNHAKKHHRAWDHG